MRESEQSRKLLGSHVFRLAGPGKGNCGKWEEQSKKETINHQVLNFQSSISLPHLLDGIQFEKSVLALLRRWLGSWPTFASLPSLSSSFWSLPFSRRCSRC